MWSDFKADVIYSADKSEEGLDVTDRFAFRHTLVLIVLFFLFLLLWASVLVGMFKFVINRVDIVRRGRLHSSCKLPTHSTLGMK